MTYTYSVRYLMNSPVSSSDTPPVLLRFKLVMRLLGDPQEKLKCIAVSGAEEKSALARMVMSVLNNGRNKTGLIIPEAVTSKACAREGILINGVPVSTELFADAVGRVYEIAETVRKSYMAVKNGADFESGVNAITSIFAERNISPVLTREEVLYAAASLIFSQLGSDIVVFTSTYGGRNAPALSMPSPCIAVVGTIPDVSTADSELALIRKGVREVVTENQAQSVFGLVSEKCAGGGVRLTVTARAELKIGTHTLGGTEFTYRNSAPLRLPSPLAGRIFRAGAVFELAGALRRNGFNITFDDIAAGLASYKAEAYCDPVIVSVNPLIIVTPLSSATAVDDLMLSIGDVVSLADGNIGLYYDNLPSTSQRRIFEFFKRNRNENGIVVSLRKDSELDSLLSAERFATVKYVEGDPSDAVSKLKPNDTLIVFSSPQFTKDESEKLRSAIVRKDIGRKK